MALSHQHLSERLPPPSSRAPPLPNLRQMHQLPGAAPATPCRITGCSTCPAPAAHAHALHR
eukprot:2596923-Pyramimonas_sp.AAC.1